jgi:hypothetical protein
VPVQILLSQAATPPGSPGEARDDFVTGTPVQATATGGPFAQYLWSFVSKAIDVEAGTRASSAFGSATSPTTSVDPIDVAGEYLIQVVVDSGSGLGATEDDVARIVFYAGDVGDTINGPLNTDVAELPQRMPAFRETLEDNVPDAIDPSGNTEGWSRPWLKLKAVVNRMYQGKSWAWARVTMTGGGASVAAGFNTIVTRTGVGTCHVQFTRNLPNANYAVIPTARGVGGSCTVSNELFDGFDLERADIGGSLVDADFTFELKVQV